MANVVWIVLDCVRSDFLGSYGNEEVYTPTIDALAHRGVKFNDHVTAAPWTNPSITSMVTGIYPHNLQMFRFREKFPPDVDTIYHYLREAGYELATFTVSEGWFGENDFVKEKGLTRDIGCVLDTIQAYSGEDFFLFAHYWNTHLPYFDKFSKEAWYDARDDVLELIRRGDLRKAKNLYRASIERASEEFVYAVVEKLQDEEILDDTYIVVTGDHGETWGDRLDDRSKLTVFGMHGKHLYEEVLQVPLIISGPDLPGNVEVDVGTRSFDVAPTLLDLLDVSSTDQFDGDSLVPLVGAADPAHRPIISSTSYIDNPDEDVDAVISKICYRGERWKLISNYIDDEYAEAEYELYDLEDDPGEKHNLQSERPDVLEELRGELAVPAEAIRDTQHDHEVIHDRLDELGYM